jgi:peptide/nickel transport system ATP-binding protein
MGKLELLGLTVQFGYGRTALTALDGVDLSIPSGGTLALVGESGSGKSTLGRAVVQLVPLKAGSVLLDGEDFTNSKGTREKELRRRVQMVFQDPYSSLNPRMSVGEAIAEAIDTHHGLERHGSDSHVARFLELVNLDPAMATRYPHQFSGGQRQRIALARALAVQPEVLILDEVTSSVDVSVQASMLNLLRELQRSLGLTYLFISHCLAVVRLVSDVVAVMYMGRIMEYATVEQLFTQPRHPYTKALIDSIPQMTVGKMTERVRLEGEIPDPRHPPSGCRFRTRCPFGPLRFPERTDCEEADPQASLSDLSSSRKDRLVACHFPLS